MLQVKQKNMCSCTYNVIYINRTYNVVYINRTYNVVYIDFNKSCFDSQFNSCLLVSLCHGHTVYNKMKEQHGRCIRLIYRDIASTFQTLLVKDVSVSLQLRKIQTLTSEVYKVANNVFPKLLKGFKQSRHFTKT